MLFFQIPPPDGGIIYTETNLDNLFPEPLNAITSVLFLFLAFYWTFKLWGKSSQHTFLFSAVILLYIGGIGGTVYHGLRQWSIFIVMDWLPIMLLCIAAGVYFLTRLTKWYYATGLVLLYIGFQFVLRNKITGDIHLLININYAAMAALVLFPVLAYLIKTKFENGLWVGMALLAFILALAFRIGDGWGWVSFGTHFLWHLFGAVAAHCMFQYIYRINNSDLLTA
ncbi:hypothetical protein Q763_10065 [Flavobacterium beibuense F44-8]|uniref:Hemolysin III n=1 Tax=Flavobacterium beibuense F44-8 TaxID=1406840 RepID=A0A0A2LLR3_9FLAO|nr:hypothetical protein [Flavobacterium beibuense]KGO80864.1 hypothetical protein Q763_10065 [Flavobacterium beibuense F44-8]